MRRIKRNDLVQVITGKDKGKKGKVLRLSAVSQRAIVEGINLVKKHQRKTQQDQQGGLVEVPASIHLSNLMLVCKNCNRPSKVGIMVMKDGAKSRMCRKCKEAI